MNATKEKSAFLAEVERLMEEKGIEDLEELHERFMEEDPERIGNARWTFERFMRHTSSEAGALYPKFVYPLVAALEATDEEIARLFLAWGEDATRGPLA